MRFRLPRRAAGDRTPDEELAAARAKSTAARARSTKATAGRRHDHHIETFISNYHRAREAAELKQQSSN